mgnify:CR=1 FL=1
MRIAVIDGQGGGIGKHITEKLRKTFGDKIEIIALATNAWAAASMLNAGANEAASGENAICYSIKSVDIIVGPLGIVIPNSMLGEITPAMATAIASSEQEKFLLPICRDQIKLISSSDEPLPHLINDLISAIKAKMADSLN